MFLMGISKIEFSILPLKSIISSVIFGSINSNNLFSPLIVIIIYVLGLIFGALVLSLSDAKTGTIAIVGMIWTFIFLVMLFHMEKRFRINNIKLN